MFELINYIFPIIFPIVVILVLSTIFLSLVRSIITWNKNNHSPKLTVPVVIVAKRKKIKHYKNGISTSYYVTFQVESGDRIEFCVSKTQYEMLIEGDNGKLTFQGTRYLSFER